MTAHSLATFDDRPYFDKALHYAVKQNTLSSDRLETLKAEFAKGIVQIANYFGTAYLRPDLELATRRMVNLVSLSLHDQFGNDIQGAAMALRDKTLLSHSKAGSDMLKRLNALPDNTLVMSFPVSPESQRAYLDEMTAADTISLEDYRAELAVRQENQNVIDFAYWLAKTMGVDRHDVDDSDSLIRTAMLVLFVDEAELKIPTRTGFVSVFKAAKNSKNRLNDSRLNRLLKEAPTEFRRLAQAAMARFIEKDLPHLRKSSTTADKLLYGQDSAAYFVRESLDEDGREYDRLVAKEWDHITQGNADDPAVVATMFLLIATGHAPKPSLLLREAKATISRFRTHGFDSDAVMNFVAEYAPESQREDLQRFWREDLKRDAEEQMSDTDPNWPDTHMERALDYLRKTCVASWKGRKR
ncbi:MAG: hypothetical protein IV085_03325 [Thiobacillus sp.]|nr:hypothetical protein [Thiobacillus sp.]